MAARKHRPPATLAAVSFSCKYRTEKNAAPPATPTSLRSAGCTVDKQHHCTSASNSPHGQLPARLHCINMQPKDCKTFLGSGKPNLAENRAPPNGRKPALLKTAARLPKSDYTPLKRTTHIPSGIHILRCINIQPKDWQVFTENNKPHPPENCVHYNCRKPALPKTATRLQESYSTPLKRTIHIPSGIHILRCINIQPKDWQVFTENNKPHPPENCVHYNCRKPALLKTAARLPKSDYTPLKRTTHIPSGIHILRCINIQPKDWQVFTENNKPHPPENCVHYNCRKPALPKTATRLQESYSTPLKRTIHIPSGTHILRCINIQPRDWETFLGSGKSNLQENCIPSNCRKPALPKIATRLRGLKTPHLLAATHLQNRATSLR